MGNNLSKEVVSMKINEKVREELIVNMKTEIASLNKLIKCRGEEIAKSHIDIINMTQENEELKKQIEDLNEHRADHLSCVDILLKENQELKAELKVVREVEINGLCGYKTQIDELKAENEKLKEQLAEDKEFKEDLASALWDAGYNPTDQIDTNVERLIENCEKLKKENEELKKGLSKEELDKTAKVICNLLDTTEGHKKENEELKKEIEGLKEQALCNNTHDSCCMCDVCEENDKLKEEIDQLKDEREVNLLSIKKLKMEKEMLVKLSRDKLSEKKEQIEKLKETLTKVDSLVSPVLFG